MVVYAQPVRKANVYGHLGTPNWRNPIHGCSGAGLPVADEPRHPRLLIRSYPFHSPLPKSLTNAQTKRSGLALTHAVQVDG